MTGRNKFEQGLRKSVAAILRLRNHHGWVEMSKAYIAYEAARDWANSAGVNVEPYERKVDNMLEIYWKKEKSAEALLEAERKVRRHELGELLVGGIST